MSLALLIFVPVFVAFGFLYWGSLLSDDDWFLKRVFQLFFIPLAWLSLNFAVIYIKLVYSSDVELVALLGDFVEYLGYVFFMIGVYYVIKIMIEVKNGLSMSRQNKKDAMYDE